MSKRRLIELVEGGYVDGWDDPRMPTLVGLRRRGYTPESIRLFSERIGVSKAHQWIDISVLEACLREDLNERAERRVAVLDPVRLVIDNFPEGHEETCLAPNHPQKPELGQRELPLTRELWIERDDFSEQPPKGYFRLFPGGEVRLRYGYIIKCVGAERDAGGNIVAVHCTYDPQTRSGTPGAESRKVKGNIHWLSTQHASRCEVRLYDRLFVVPEPGRAREAVAIAPAHGDAGDDSTRISTTRSPPSATTSTTSIPSASVSSRRTSSRRWRGPRLNHATSSSATATSSPTRLNPPPIAPYSIAR